jgi:hypothetical protein
MEGRLLINNLHDVDADVKAKATAYFMAAKTAEENLEKYE